MDDRDVFQAIVDEVFELTLSKIAAKHRKRAD
jgi:hypothetical protein